MTYLISESFANHFLTWPTELQMEMSSLPTCGRFTAESRRRATFK